MSGRDWTADPCRGCEVCRAMWPPGSPLERRHRGKGCRVIDYPKATGTRVLAGAFRTAARRRTRQGA